MMKILCKYQMVSGSAETFVFICNKLEWCKIYSCIGCTWTLGDMEVRNV